MAEEIDKVDLTEVDPPEKEDKEVKETERLKRALAALQKEKEKAASELAEFKTATERAKMTEQDRIKAELEEKRVMAEQAQARYEALVAERERDRDVMYLVAKQDLLDPDFGEMILRKRQEGETLDELATRLRKDSKMKVLFQARAAAADVEVVETHGNAASRRKTPVADVSDDDKARAKQLYPFRPELQAAYLEKLKNSSRKA